MSKYYPISNSGGGVLYWHLRLIIPSQHEQNFSLSYNKRVYN
jgi:hypothetical protein